MLGKTAFVVISSLFGLHITGGISADDKVYQVHHQHRSNGLTKPDYQHVSTIGHGKSLDFNTEAFHRQFHPRVAKVMPGVFLDSYFPKVHRRQSNINFLHRDGSGKNKPISAHRMEEKNDIELYVSSVGTSEAMSREEMIRLLNINTMHHSSGPFGTTAAPTEKNVFKDHHEKNNVWDKEGFCVLVICLTIFIIIFTCLMVGQENVRHVTENSNRK